MSIAMAPFADAEKVAKNLILSRATYNNTAVATVTETNQQTAVPNILIQRIPSDRVNDGVTDFPMIRATVTGGTRAASWQIARDLEQIVLSSIRTVVEVPEDNISQLIDNAEVRNELIQDNNDPGKKSVSMAFRLSLRRPKEN